MSLLQQIKTDQINARKARAPLTAQLLTTLIGEAEMVGKNAGNREVTDIEVVSLIKKFIKNISEVLKVVDVNSEAWDKATQEQMILEQYLPKQLTADQLRAELVSISTELNAHTLREMGKVMKVLKERFDGQYDGAAASTIIKEVLA